MRDAESEQPQDEFEVHFIDLDDPACADANDHFSVTNASLRRWKVLSRHTTRITSSLTRTAANTLSRGEAIVPTIQPFLRRPDKTRQRRLHIAITASIVVLTVLLILVSTPSVRNLTAEVFLGPALSPTTPLAPESDLFYIEANPPWGHLSVDGQPFTHPATIGIDTPLRLSPGTHLLIWQAAPFFTQHCTLSVPANFARDTCNHKESLDLRTGSYVSIISFGESLDTLPTNQRFALIQAANLALDAQQSTDVVRPGEFYALSPTDPTCRPSFPSGEPHCYTVARQPLKATLSLQLDIAGVANETCIGPEQDCTFFNINCRLFCPTNRFTSFVTGGWNVFAVVLPRWQYATMDGQILAYGIPNNSLWDLANGKSADESFIGLSITWDAQGWHVVIPANNRGQNIYVSNPVCSAVDLALQLFPSPTDANNTILDVSWQDAAGTVRAAGCATVATITHSAEPAATPSNAPPLVAYCLHRFGVLLAANAVAHHFWPSMPLADAYEQHLAQEMVDAG